MAEYTFDVQKLYIEMLLADAESFARAQNIFKPESFDRKLQPIAKFVIVTEGPFDAIAVSGVSILGSEINDTQRELIDGLGRQVIVVPDRDAPGEKLINQAIEFGWSVAFPDWDKTVGDVADAVLKYGRLFTLQSILKTTESSKLKIDLKRKMYG